MSHDLTPLIGRSVEVQWHDPAHDWPYFRVVEVLGHCVKLRGEDYPDGSGQHDGSVFWCEQAEIRRIVPCERKEQG